MKNELQKLYLHRLNNLRIMVCLLNFAPFIRCIILNGSVASGRIKTSSDIDLLIIAKSRRIFTCRAAVLFWAYISGLKRSSVRKKGHVGRFCFNYFLTDNFLTIPHDRGEKVDKYCAENYSKSILVWGDRKLFNKYMRINLVWMKKFLSSFRHPVLACPERGRRDTGSPPTGEAGTNSSGSISRFPTKSGMTASASIIEKILSGRFGDWVERVVKNIQVRKINKDPKVKNYPQLIVVNDRELRFHPPQPHKKFTSASARARRAGQN